MTGKRSSSAASPKSLKRLAASAAPRSFPLFSITSRLRKPSRRELDAALLVCETLLGRQIPCTTASVWDALAALGLPATQESWIRALFMDLGGPSPHVVDPRRRETLFKSYLSTIRRELRALLRDGISLDTAPASPFSSLKGLL